MWITFGVITINFNANQQLINVLEMWIYILEHVSKELITTEWNSSKPMFLGGTCPFRPFQATQSSMCRS
jgi:hypothetical protein